LSAVLSVPVLGDLLKYSMSFDDMHEHLFLCWTYAGGTLKVAENKGDRWYLHILILKNRNESK
jgi:hypothetical protein